MSTTKTLEEKYSRRLKGHTDASSRHVIMVLTACGQDWERVIDICSVIHETTKEPYHSIRRRVYTFVEYGWLSKRTINGITEVRITNTGMTNLASFKSRVDRCDAIRTRLANDEVRRELAIHYQNMKAHGKVKDNKTT
jgi:hypothetical protein